ncbi:hypothetical protein D3C87_1508960 [compost metagenome]
MPAAAREVDHIVDHERAALLVTLHHEADAVPAGEVGFEAEAFEQVERDFEAVCLFRIDIDADVVLARQHRQGLQAAVEFRDHALVLGAAVARMQRGQLDRDARALVDAPAA